MSEKFWKTIWLALFTFLILLVMSISTCTMYKSKKIAEVIISGANPMEAKIAFSNQSATSWFAIRELGKAANGGK